MNRVAEFEKVSFEQYYKDMKDEFYEKVCLFTGVDDIENEDGFRKVVRDMYDNIKLPVRATTGSMGYDFKAPFGFTLAPGETIKIPTCIRAHMDEGWGLMCYPRSSLGFKYRAQLDNGTALIDGDFYYSDNEGHIFAKITNDGKQGKIMTIDAGDGFMQGVFIPYGITVSDNVTATRNGGIGSTGK